MRAQVLNHYYVTSFCIVETIRSAAKSFIIGALLVTIPSVVSVPSYAQTKFKIYDKESGLSSDNVTCITQDHVGYLWIGTENGLNRFDGSSFKIFRYSPNDSNSLSSNAIRCLAVDKFNRIWIGHESGITRYDPGSNEFARFRITDDDVTFISFDKRDRVWVGIGEGGAAILNLEAGTVEKKLDLVQFINKGYNKRAASRFNTVDGMVEDSTGKIWLASHDGLYEYDEKLEQIKPVRVAEDTPGKHRNDYFKAILADKNNDLWLAAHRGGVCHYSPDQKLFKVHQSTLRQYESDKDISFTNIVNDIAWKNDRELWVTTWDRDKPLGTFDIQTKSFSFLNLSDNFGNEIKSNKLLLRDLFVDRDGVVWAASRMGLVMVNPRVLWDFTSIIKIDSLISVSAIVEDTVLRKRFLATLFGPGLIVSNIDNGTSRSFRGRVNQNYGGSEYIQGLLNTPGDSLWVISRDNIRLFDKVREEWIDLPALQRMENDSAAATASFYKMIRATSGDYWVATLRNGAYKLNKTDLSFVNYSQQKGNKNSICSNFLIDVLEDKFGRIWFASRTAGISILDPATNTFETLNVKGKGSQFLPSNGISDIEMDQDGNVWISTLQVGIIKLEVISKDSLKLITFSNELLTSPASELKIDAQGMIWFRAGNVYMLDPKIMNIKSFEGGEGLFDMDYALLKSNGQVLLHSSFALGIIDQNDLVPDTTSRPIVINSVKVFGKEICPGGVYQARFSLPYDQNSLAIEFGAIDFLYNQKIKYSYKLEGLENSDWTPASTNRSTEFANLDGGEYVFKVRILNQEGTWSEERSLLNIHIGTPFWETNWFYALLALIISSMIALTYFYQIRRIKIREKERSEINKRISQLQLKALHTQMRPHFIFNCLSAINGHIVKFETVKASEFLSQFSRLMRGILENSTESWITLEQEIETLRLYLVMEDLRFENKFSYRIEVEDGVNPSAILIPSMIIQPYVENAIGHGLLHKEQGTGVVLIKFLKGEGNIKCIIEDNGIGRERSSQIKQRMKISRKSLGLQITSERLQLLQGSSAADIQDLKNELGEPAGTRIIIMLMTKEVEDNDLGNLN